ncbi:integrase_H2C2 domain-containing protein [Trichonephila clavipes]|nr:integrase_H2C2 domain-containing protein [Trichonephila clavipes]
MKPRFRRVFCQRKHRSTLRILKGILLHVGMKWEHWVLRMRRVTAEMDKGIMVADSFRSEQECCAELALVWKYAKEGKGNYYEVDGYLFRRDKILGESIGQLVIPKCRRTEVLKLAHTSVFSSHMGPKKTLERIKYSFFWEGLRADVK